MTTRQLRRLFYEAANEAGIKKSVTLHVLRHSDYRIEGPGRYKTMTLPTREFIRRFLIHVLPKGLPDALQSCDAAHAA
jgi:hypothetical protein